eukprot:CAMPEP_0183357922 /NCGR_PEP_ID=MMETSP0164_2-20130417/47729_1 /TAXON_ID=221442 /ORGANISM="Coccolithus pelagicus ssp braarudi, Strain PLY182g" /LENGTH=287 /DNA_ID=CAMNT_0025531679 /DNA_START=17 /DNA_END=880 /DNA_ORIENTATION=+
MSVVHAQRLVFCLAGQSNMAGRGALPVTTPPGDVRIRSFSQRSDVWETAANPLHSDKPEKAGVGPGLSFARVLLRALPSQQIMLVPCAWGGSPISRWAAKGGDLFNEAKRRTQLALEQAGEGAVLAGILWHQGESDCGEVGQAESHMRETADALAHLREELGAPTTPILAGELGNFLDRNDSRFAFADIVNAGIAGLPKQLTSCTLVTAHGLGHRGDRLHFDTAAQNELGARYGAAWLRVSGILSNHVVAAKDAEASDLVVGTCMENVTDVSSVTEAAGTCEVGELD